MSPFQKENFFLGHFFSSPWFITLLLLIHSLNKGFVLISITSPPISLYSTPTRLFTTIYENCFYPPNQFPTFYHIPLPLLPSPYLTSLPFSRTSHLSLNLKKYLNTNTSKIRIPHQLNKLCIHHFQSFLSFYPIEPMKSLFSIL